MNEQRECMYNVSPDDFPCGEYGQMCEACKQERADDRSDRLIYAIDGLREDIKKIVVELQRLPVGQ